MAFIPARCRIVCGVFALLRPRIDRPDRLDKIICRAGMRGLGMPDFDECGGGHIYVEIAIAHDALT